MVNGIPDYSTPGAVPVQPGITQLMEQQRINLEKYIADLQARLDEAQIFNQQLALEAQLSASPIDFVAYQLYKRGLEESGRTPFTGPSASDEDIQDAFAEALGFDAGESVPGGAGKGRFGVRLPQAGQISREQFSDLTKSDLDILTSFLRGGVRTGTRPLRETGGKPTGEFTAVDPEEYFRQVEERFVPVYAGPSITTYG